MERRPERTRGKRRNKESEANIQKEILKTLSKLGILSNRVNSGAFKIITPDRGTRNRGVRCNSINGKSDIESWIRILSPKGDIGLGITLYIEVKRPGEKQNPNQVEFQRLMKKTSQEYWLVTSPSDVINHLLDFETLLGENLPGWTVDVPLLKNMKRTTDE